MYPCNLPPCNRGAATQVKTRQVTVHHHQHVLLPAIYLPAFVQSVPVAWVELRVEPPWGARHGTPWRRSRGTETGHCPAWPPGTVAGLRRSWGVEEGWGGVSPGVRKVLGGHQKGPPAGQEPPGGKGHGRVTTGLHRAGAGGRLPHTWGALPSPLGDTIPASPAPGPVPGGWGSARPPGSQAGGGRAGGEVRTEPRRAESRGVDPSTPGLLGPQGPRVWYRPSHPHVGA